MCGYGKVKRLLNESESDENVYGIKRSIIQPVLCHNTYSEKFLGVFLCYLFRLNHLIMRGARLRPIWKSRPREGVKNENALLKPILNKETLFQLLRTLFQSFLSICSELFSSFCNKAR